MLRYPLFPLLTIVAAISSNYGYSYIQIYIGRGFDCIITPGWMMDQLVPIAVGIVGAALLQGGSGLLRGYSIEILAQRIERDCRDELYASLLGKSQTFHGQQRIGDIMARATNDIRALNLLFSPGLMLIIDSMMNLVVPITLIGFLEVRLLPIPLVFTVLLVLTIADYNRRLRPVSIAQRDQFGAMNAGLAEATEGIELIKANARENFEWRRFSRTARLYRDTFVRQGAIQANYLPMLAFSLCLALAFGHGLWLWHLGVVTLGQVIAFMGLMSALRFPTFISIFSFNLVQLGLASADRILTMINTETQLDENRAGVRRPCRGDVRFENVYFGYNGKSILKNISFGVQSGETIAIVGQTGSGKTTLTRLINRIFDANRGCVLVDGIDVRQWNLESLRSQISTIEQDIFLYSRSVTDNIGFGCLKAGMPEIEEAARKAQAHEFITDLANGYDTTIGERGVTLSGGQKQRLAIARAFLTDPRILILDDSTSAVDSATEDRIQRAIRGISRDRTTFIITHRLSQIRWADRILVLGRGAVVDQGTHEELMERCRDYQRIFARCR
jgi:ATP-binding cassette subfamily B protein